MQDWDVVVVGAGAAGMFAALRACELAPETSVCVLESASRPLRKVAISGGGRCNVTHDCDDLVLLLQHYPRGGRRLSKIFSRFMPADTRHWFESRGVKLKVEADGRLFPVSDDSKTIIDCLLKEGRRRKLNLLTEHKVKGIHPDRKRLLVQTSRGTLRARKVLLAPGGSARAFQWAAQMGHQIVPPVPSLFTFNITDPRLSGLQGISLPHTRGQLAGVTQEGPLLITHWGLSGPVVLKLSAWAAPELHACGYRSEMVLDLVPEHSQQELRRVLAQNKAELRGRVGSQPPLDLPRRLWERLADHAGLDPDRNWPQAPKKALNRLAEQLKQARFEITGKGVFKEEFVTAGGVPLAEVKLDTMESKLVPRLFFAGEILNVDGLTGGFNFQNAWATGWIAGEGLVS